ncbi:MAG: hypothetical protein EAX91_16035, partial [Candidatus Lokiarchaeota archaeon]|nr:hypothetical protein [Candidatus Lokiarchaeota archaeon]
MTERNSENEITKEVEEFEGDPTKKAFFSDMEDMEEEIAAEAIELVQHALSLVATQFYDDSIEILKQAIGLYAQINKLAEIDALNNKISEIYLLKEKAFRERELETSGEIEIAQDEVLLVPNEEDSYKEADALIVKAIELVNNKNFDAALDAYDDAIRILKNLRKSSEIEKINELIEDCYNRKAEFLREQRVRTAEESKLTQHAPENEMSELELKAQRIRAFEENKRKESEKSNQAYELIGRATELKNLKQFDEAKKLLEESIVLFEEINWTNEVNKIKHMIEQIEGEKIRFQFELQQVKEKEQQEIQKERQNQAQLLERATVEEQVKQKAQVEALRKQAEKEQEETAFQNEITEMINHAEKIAREYDIKMKKGVKKGVLVGECVYPAVIKIYERVRTKVSERGWKEQVAIYNNQINHYNALLEKDEKLREIESQKLQKQRDFDESLKVKEDIQDIKAKVDQASQLKEQRDREAEILKFRRSIEKSVNNAEKMAREYEFQFKKAVKSGNLTFESKYPEIIRIITDARDSALKKGWDEDARIYSTHIRKYADLYDKEKKVRELEGKKDESKKIYEDFRKIKKDGFDLERLKELEAQKLKEIDEKNFQEEINKLVDEAEKLARDYDIALKKALKEGNLIEDSPFSKIIELYCLIRDNFIAKGWKDQVVIYNNQIKIYQEKWENDKKLRELEHQKIQKQKEYEESLKVKLEKDVPSESREEIDSKQQKLLEDKIFQDDISERVNHAEMMAREYELAMKKALKNGKLIEDSPYIEIIEIYTEIRNKLLEKGWVEQSLIYTNQIKVYQEKLENDKKLRELEHQKIQKQKEYEESLKVKLEKDAPSEGIEEFDSKQQKLLEDKNFQDEISERVNHAEMMAREYELAMKKALKNGKLIEISPYIEIIEIYTEIRNKLLEKGWVEQSLIYTNQIKVYQEKLENDKKLRDLEHQKIQKQREYEESLKIKLEKEVPSESIEEIDSKQQKLLEDKNFQDEISERVNHAEKMAREYELAMKEALKKGKLIEVSPYIEIIEIYSEIRNKLLEKGWVEQSLIYTNQIKVYQEKLENDKKLRELESRKALEQEEFEKAIKSPKGEGTIGKDVEKLKKLEELTLQEREEEKFTREIDDIVDKAEREARNYELTIKKGAFEVSCPYMEIAEVYRKIREKVFSRGWKDEAEIYGNQIKLYQEKFEKDKRLRELEADKIEKQRAFEEALKTKKEPKVPKLEEISRERSESDEISAKAMDLIDEAEKSVRSYELSIKKDILTYKSPYGQAISNYEKAYKLFQTIGWNEEAQKLMETIKFYRDKKVHDDNLRVLEEQKVLEQEALIKKQKIHAKLTREAEEELLKMKTQALEAKKRSAMEYESKKEQAFDFMDLAKNELKQNNFEKAVSYYKESEKIFAEINWPEGIRMIKESINLIKVKKDRIKREAELIEQKKKEKLIIEAQIKEKISKAKDLHDLQQEQRRKELLAIQEEKEREREISEKALGF